MGRLSQGQIMSHGTSLGMTGMSHGTFLPDPHLSHVSAQPILVPWDIPVIPRLVP